MKPPLRYISRRSSELFFLRTVRVCASVGLGGAELSSPGEVLGKGVIFVACRKAPCSGVRESGCGVENEEAAISTPTFLFAVNEHYSSGGGGWYTVYGGNTKARIGGELEGRPRYRGVQSRSGGRARIRVTGLGPGGAPLFIYSRPAT